MAELDLTKVKQSVAKLGQDMIDHLVSVLKSGNKYASNDLINSINYRYIVDFNDLRILISSLDYIEYVDRGRKPGKYAPIAPIRKWVQLKGLPKGIEYAVNHSIYKFGIKPFPILQPTIDKFAQPSILRPIVKAYTDSITDYLTKKAKE
jgi:hypothetical protein